MSKIVSFELSNYLVCFLFVSIKWVSPNNINCTYFELKNVSALKKLFYTGTYEDKALAGNVLFTIHSTYVGHTV